MDFGIVEELIEVIRAFLSGMMTVVSTIWERNLQNIETMFLSIQ